MPRALPGVDTSARRDRHPLHVEGEALVADPLRPPLELAAAAAALHAQLAGPRAFPVGRVELVRFGDRARQAGGQHVRRRAGRGAHSISSGPSSMLETGVTMGPEMTRPTRASFTWLVDSPRSWRTASIWSSSPCM